MEKKPTRDQALIRLIRESAEKDARIKELETENKEFEKRLKLLEKEFRVLSATVKEQGRSTRAQRDKTNLLEHNLNGVTDYLRRAGKR